MVTVAGSIIHSKLEELVKKYKYADDIVENVEEYLKYIQKNQNNRVVKYNVALDTLKNGQKYIMISWSNGEGTVYNFGKEL